MQFQEKKLINEVTLLMNTKGITKYKRKPITSNEKNIRKF